MIPEAVAFAFVAGVSPIVGLQTTAVLGFVAAAFGGRGGITTGASGACAVVVAGLVASHGPSYLSAAVALAGLIQVSLGVLGAGKFIRLVPHPVMLGFVNGLGGRHDPGPAAPLPGAVGLWFGEPRSAGDGRFNFINDGSGAARAAADAGRAADACRSLFGVRSVVGAETARHHISRFGGQGGLRRRIESPAVVQSAGGLLGFEDRPGCLPEGGAALRGDDGVRRLGGGPTSAARR